MADNQPAQSPQKRPVLPEVTIEIVNKDNRQLVFGPTQQILRGRWDAHNLASGDQSESGLFKMPTIPGLHVTVNVQERFCRIDDPLSYPENRTLLQEMSNVHKLVLKEDRTFVPSTVRENVSEDEMGTWLYWMIRAVKSGNARTIIGRLPETKEDILKVLPNAKIRTKFFDSADQEVMAQVRESAAYASTNE